MNNIITVAYIYPVLIGIVLGLYIFVLSFNPYKLIIV